MNLNVPRCCVPVCINNGDDLESLKANFWLFWPQKSSFSCVRGDFSSLGRDPMPAWAGCSFQVDSGEGSDPDMLAAVCPFWIKQPTPFAVSSRLLGSLGSFVGSPCCFVPSGKGTGPVLNGAIAFFFPQSSWVRRGELLARWHTGFRYAARTRQGLSAPGSAPGGEPDRKLKMINKTSTNKLKN